MSKSKRDYEADRATSATLRALVDVRACLWTLVLAAEHSVVRPHHDLRKSMNRAYELLGPIDDCPYCPEAGEVYDHAAPSQRPREEA